VTIAPSSGRLAPTAAELWGLVPDPDTDPPDGDEAWLADVPAVMVHAYAEASGAPGPADVFLPGGVSFRERPGGGPGAGFGAAGTADRLVPGTVLAGLTDRAHARLAQVSDAELIGLARAWRRLSSWACAGELATASELARRRDADVAAGADPHLAEHTSDELAAALTLTCRAADGLMDFALALNRLPATRASLRRGDIDRARAYVIVNETTGLADDHAAAVDAAVSGAAPRQTTGQLRAAARRAVLTADPAAADRRREQAKREARVETWDERSGTAALAGRDLPPADVLAADQHISDLARRLQAAGVPGTLDQLRARAYLALLLGRSPRWLSAQGRDPRDRTGVPGTGAIMPGTGAVDEAAESAFGPGLRSPVAAGPGNPVTSPPAGNPVTSPPAGNPVVPSPAGNPVVPSPATARDNPAAASSAAGIANPDLPGFGPGWFGPGASPIATGAVSSAPLAPGSINLTMPLSTWLGTSGAPGEVPGFGPVPAADARMLATLGTASPGTRWCITLTGKDGRAVAHGCARIPAARARAAGPAGAGWELALTIRPIASGTCDHQHEVAGYQPSAGLRHVVSARQRRCSFPGCRRGATGCDQDHTIPYDSGGRTCQCNLAPLCRRHHRAKQAQRWRLDQPEPGVMVWTLPHGRSYRTDPEPYPGEGPGP
jgi:hypothetical protein